MILIIILSIYLRSGVLNLFVRVRVRKALSVMELQHLEQ